MLIERAVHARNGLPGLRDYSYRGSGRDELTTQAVIRAWNREVRRRGGFPDGKVKAQWTVTAAIEMAMAREGWEPPQAGPPAPAPAARRRAPDGPRIGRVASPPQWCPSCGYMTGSQGCAISCG